MQIQWNPQAHERWAKEQLVFWRLGFYPTYQREEVRQALEVVCGRHEIRGRVVYEVFGQHDLLVRLWLPNGITPDDVERDIKRTLTSFHLELCDRFVVSQIVTHWFWDEDSSPDTSPAPPGEDMLDSSPGNHVLREASDIVEAFNAGDLTDDDVRDHPVVGKYLQSGVLGMRAIRDGIKFAIIVSVPSELGTRWSIMDALAIQLEARLHKAGAVMERSLYRGDGFGRFLILGKIASANFFRINDDLVGPIVDEAQLAGIYRTRSLTYIGNSPNLMSFSEALALPPPQRDDEEINVDELLVNGESAEVEFKGSIFVNVARFMHQGDHIEDPDVTAAYVRAVVGMLNNANGGTVLSGVLEASSRNSAAHLKEMPARDGLILLGAEFDWRGWKRPEWDEFENKLRQVLSSQIEPDPTGFLTISRHEMEGISLCAVSVTTTPPMWFYLRRKNDYVFVVRRGASSTAISGPEEDTYKKFSPRP